VFHYTAQRVHVTTR